MSPLKQPLQQHYQGAKVPGGYYYLYYYPIFQLVELSLDQNTNPSFWFPKTDPPAPAPAPVCKMDAWDKARKSWVTNSSALDAGLGSGHGAEPTGYKQDCCPRWETEWPKESWALGVQYLITKRETQ